LGVSEELESSEFSAHYVEDEKYLRGKQDSFVFWPRKEGRKRPAMWIRVLMLEACGAAKVPFLPSRVQYLLVLNLLHHDLAIRQGRGMLSRIERR
jgi:hypothetical protein